MRNYVLSAALGFAALFSTSAFAQGGSTQEAAPDQGPVYKKIVVGPAVTFGASVNAGPVAQGTKTDVREAFSVGVNDYFAINENAAVGLHLMYDSRKVNFHPESSTDTYTNATFSYFMIEPTFKIKSFTIGAGIGLPTSATQVTHTETPSADVEADYPFNQATLVEVRVGAAIPVVEMKEGDLYFLINGSYPFTKITDDKRLGLDSGENNGPLASLQLGFSYLFNVMSSR